MDYSQALNIGKPFGDTVPVRDTVTQIENVGRALSAVAFSSVALGALGGLCRGLFNNKGFSYTFKAVILGAVISMVVSPFVQARLSEDIVPFTLFIIGYSGFTGLDFLLNLSRSFIERHFEDIVSNLPFLKFIKKKEAGGV